MAWFRKKPVEVEAVRASLNRAAAERTAKRVTQALSLLEEYGDPDLQKESIEYLTAQCRAALERR